MHTVRVRPRHPMHPMRPRRPVAVIAYEGTLGAPAPLTPAQLVAYGATSYAALVFGLNYLIRRCVDGILRSEGSEGSEGTKGSDNDDMLLLRRAVSARNRARVLYPAVYSKCDPLIPTIRRRLTPNFPEARKE